MAENVEYTINLVWGVIRRLILVGVGLYVAFRYGPHVLAGLRTAAVCVLGAVLLTYILLPGVDLMCRKRWSKMKPRTQRLVATSIVFVVFLALIAGSIALAISPLQKEANVFVKSFNDYKVTFAEWAEKIGSIYARSVPESIQQRIESADYSRVASSVTAYARQGISVLTSSIAFIVELVLVPVLAFYFVFDHKQLTREIYGLAPRHRRREVIKIGHNVGHVLQSYIFGQLILCAIAGILTGVVLAALDVPYVLVLALFAAVTRAIPVIGPVVSGIPIVLVGVLNFDGPTIPIMLFVVVVVMHFAESKFIMPQLIGERLHLHPAVVIIVLLIGAEFFGLIGMFMAAPVAAVVRELVRSYYIRPERLRDRRDNDEDISGLIETRSAS